MKRISILRRLEALEGGSRRVLQAIIILAATRAEGLLKVQAERERLGLGPRDVVPTIIVTCATHAH